MTAVSHVFMDLKNLLLPILITVSGTGCMAGADDSTSGIRNEKMISSFIDDKVKTIHVLVALCDNKYQGIVPVPAKIGNGQDPDQNLYWGCAFGIKTFFKNSKDWTLVRKYKLNDTILERVVFRHRTQGYYLVADAFNGKYIRQCTETLLAACAGSFGDIVHTDGKVLGLGAYAQLRAYIGHDGLMDFSLDKDFNATDTQVRDVIILACYSKRFFNNYLKKAGSNPILWSTGLMSPEAYTLHDALIAYIKKEPTSLVRKQAARAYSRYQKCSERAALNLLVSGF
jgi:hypothetical protein